MAFDAQREEIGRLTTAASRIQAAGAKIAGAVAQLRLVFQENPNTVTAHEYGAITKAIESALDARAEFDDRLAEFNAILTEEQGG